MKNAALLSANANSQTRDFAERDIKLLVLKFQDPSTDVGTIAIKARDRAR